MELTSEDTTSALSFVVAGGAVADEVVKLYRQGGELKIWVHEDIEKAAAGFWAAVRASAPNCVGDCGCATPKGDE